MAAITIRNLPDATHRALKVRAAQHGRSAEAEIRNILESAVRSDTRLRLGSELAERSRKLGLTNKDVAVLEQTRDRGPAKPMSLE
jgi:antitoxin FitA